MKTLVFLNYFLKYAIAIILCFMLNFTAYSEAISVYSILPELPQLSVKSFILIDYNSDKVLAEKNADTLYDPASLTKMMTSYVIGKSIKEGKCKETDIVTIGNNAWATGNPIFKGSSLMFLKPGMKVPVFKLIRGINLQSGNDACVAMADFIAGSQSIFINLMNHYSSCLGLKNTRFNTVHGLDAENQYTSARDMALLGQALIRDLPREYATYKEKEFTFNGIKQRNRNGLLWDSSLNVDGIKTGYTNRAGYHLVASAISDRMRLISVVMGASSFKQREEESKKLLTWGFRFFETVHAVQAEKSFALEPVWFSDKNHAYLGSSKDIYITIPRGKIKDLKASYELYKNALFAPLKKNQIVGEINFQLDSKTIQKFPLVVLEDIPEGRFFNKIFDYMKLVFHRTFN